MSPERQRLLDIISERLGPRSNPALDELADAMERQFGDISAALAALAGSPTMANSGETRIPDIGTIAPDPGAGGDSDPFGRPFWAPQAGRYVVPDPDRPHKEGGLGAVFIAHDTEVNRRVALKEIKRKQVDDPASRARFVFEASVTGRLEHPGIVPVYGLGTYSDGRPFYAMRFVEGRSLEEAIQAFHAEPDRDLSIHSLTLRQLLERFLDICDALQYSHDRGVLHRDLKPQNVMLGDYGETFVVDWGLARLWKEPGEDIAGNLQAAENDGLGFATLHGTAIGTPGYMSPEQAAGRLDELGPATDIYGLGAILYAMLTGRPVHPKTASTQLPDLLARIERGDMEMPRAIRPEADPALEAICLKALARSPGERYPSARALADDVRRWLADEPVSAWREPFGRRARRWVGKHRTLVTGVAVGLLAVLLGTVTYSVQRLTSARGRVEALRSAQIRAVPGILDDLESDRHLVLDRLRALTADVQDEESQLRGLLALVRDDPRHATELARRMVLPSTTPDELIVIRNSIHSEAVAGAMAGILKDGDEGPIDIPTDERLRALASLAKFDPAHPRWRRDSAGVAARLVRESPLHLGAWREAFQPVARDLVAPLRAIYMAQATPEAHDRAYLLLREFATQPGNAYRPEDLAALIPDAEPDRLAEILEALPEADRPRLIAALTPMLSGGPKLDDPETRRQGRIGSALLKLKASETVWPHFLSAADPSLRTELIHGAAAYGVEVRVILDRLKAEPDASARRALILAIGSYPPDALTEAERRALAAEWIGWYRNDPDAGIHGAVEWVLDARWGQGPALWKVDKELAGKSPPPGQGWFVNAQGQTYTIIRGPVEFLMGTPGSKGPELATDPTLHRNRIPRSFAIAAREVRVDEYARFLAEHRGILDHRSTNMFRREIPTDDCAMGTLDFFDAAAFCNWLSGKDGLPESEWCYPSRLRAEMSLPKDHLQRKGYRLPTEAEWEFSARAGTASPRSFGRLHSRLPEYAWFMGNSRRLMHPPGRLKPNELGLFDTLGNAMEWCGDAYGFYARPGSGPDAPAINPEMETIVNVPLLFQRTRVRRGGGFDIPSERVGSAIREKHRPLERGAVSGLRPARTY